MNDFLLVLILLISIPILRFIFKFLKKILTYLALVREYISVTTRLSEGYITKQDIYNLSPTEFEIWCGHLLENLGYENIEYTEVIENAGDGGKDIICYKENIKIYVECKRYGMEKDTRFKVTRSTIEKLFGVMIGDNVCKGLLLTTATPTDGAFEYAKNLPKGYSIEIFGGDSLEKMYNTFIQQVTQSPQPTPSANPE